MGGLRTALTSIVTLSFSAVAVVMFVDVAVANFIPEPIPSGIRIKASSNNVTSDNHFENNKEYGVSLGYGSSCNVISRNEIVANAKDGVLVESSANNITVAENLVIENNGNGVFFGNILGSNIIKNTITLNRGCGIGFGYGPNGTIMENYISRNGLCIWISNAVGNTITWNSIVENDGWGIRLEGAQKNNVIYHNNFINNSVTESLQASILGVWIYPGFDKVLFPGEEREPPKFVDGAANFWDDGNEGNYWSDYKSRDNDGSRIGDNPYAININNQDNYPLMEPTGIEVIPEVKSRTPMLFILTVFAIILTMYESRLRRKMKNNKCMSCKN